MLRRTVAGLIVPLMLLPAVGCGASGGAEAPKVQNPTVKIKPAGDGKTPGDGGTKFKPDN